MQCSRILSLTVFLLVSLTMASCGGGGGDDGDSESAIADASLFSLTVSTGELDQFFQSSLNTYTGTVAFLQSSVAVTATSSDPDAVIEVNGLSAISGEPSLSIDLLEGANTIEVKVTAEDGTSIEVYALSITRETVTSFAQQAYIKASNTEMDDRFGWSVAISGDTLAVGAYVEASDGDGVNSDSSNNDEAFAGAVYVFTRNGDMWSQQAYIKASNSEFGDLFGYSLSLSGDTLAVGAYGESSNGVGVNSATESNNDAAESGAIYVFTRSRGVWSQQAYIKASNTEAYDRFGWQLALSGDTLAVGAWGEDSDGVGVNSGAQGSLDAPDSGAAYVFTRSGGLWSQQAYIKASNTGQDDFFGAALSLSGDTLAVGAWGEDSLGVGVDSGAGLNDGRPGAGAAYVFTRVAGIWSQQAYIKASNTDANDLFGYSVALSGDTLAVGAYFEASNGTGVNGGAQAIDTVPETGAVYVFARSATLWSQQAYIKASNSEGGDRFGYSLALADDTLAVGAYKEDSNGLGINSGTQGSVDAPDSGTVYLFTRLGATWAQQAYVKASNTGINDNFGHSLALTGDTLATGAYGEGSNGVGVNSGTQGDDSWPGAGAIFVFQ